VLAALAAALLAAGARADVLHVPKDFPTVAEALDAAQPGDEVVLAAGSYNTPILMDNLTGIVLRGQGKVVLGGGTAGTPALTLTNCFDVTVDHLRIEGAQGIGVLLGQSNSVTLRRLRVVDSVGDGIVAGEASDVLMDRCRVEGTGGSGISVVKALTFTLSHCTVLDAGTSGIMLGALHDTVVDRCHVSGSGQVGIALGLSDPVDTCVASRNVVLDAGTSGFLVRGVDNVLTDNRVQGAAIFGVHLQVGTQGGVVEGNKLIDTDSGIFSSGSGVLMRDNRIVGTDEAGLVCQQDDCVIADNRVVKAGVDGYQLDSTMDGGAIIGCKALHAGDDGFEIACSFFSITGNSSVGADANGFEITGADNVLAGNSAHGSGVLDLENLGAQNIYLDNDFGTSNLP
jgi:nitrous oxidase accessory protein NosD